MRSVIRATLVAYSLISSLGILYGMNTISSDIDIPTRHLIIVRNLQRLHVQLRRGCILSHGMYDNEQLKCLMRDGSSF
jgi:hypothetical protein